MKKYSAGDGVTVADIEHTMKLYEACFSMECEPTPAQICAFKPLLTAWMKEFEKLPADVQAKYNNVEKEWAATGKPMTESPDHLKGLEFFKACDKSGCGLLNQ